MNPYSYVKYLAKKANPIATDEIIQKRRDICQSCEHRRVEHVTQTPLCDKCGCVIKWKTAASGQSCPEKKW